MSRKRKAYRPKPIISNPLTLLQPASREQRVKVLARFLSALEALRAGSHPTPDEWRDLSDAINTVETLALHQGKLAAAEVMPTVNAAIAGMVGAANRYRAGQAMRLDGAGLEALREVVDIYAQCMDTLTEREMAQAQAETQRRVHALLRQREASTHVVSL